MSEQISQAAHEAATLRYVRACQTVAELRQNYRRDMAAAEAELAAAGDDLAAQELAPGIPAYIMAGDPWAARPHLTLAPGADGAEDQAAEAEGSEQA